MSPLILLLHSIHSSQDFFWQMPGFSYICCAMANQKSKFKGILIFLKRNEKTCCTRLSAMQLSHLGDT